MRKLLLMAACLLCAGIFQGCTVDCQHPLSDPDAKRVDERLLGTWRWMDEPWTCYLHIEKGAKDKGADFLFVQTKPGYGIRSWYGSLFTTDLGNHSFASIKPISGDGKELSKAYDFYLIVYYKIDKEGRLTWSLADPSAFAEAVNARKVKGQVNSAGPDTQVLLSASTQELAAFLKESEPKKLFPRMLPLAEKLEPLKATENPKEEEQKK